MKYKVGDEVLVKAKIITGVRKYFGVEVEDNRFDVCEDDIIPVLDMTAEEAWEIAKKLFADYSNAELDEIFGKGWSFPKLMELTPQRAKAKIEAWEAKQIKVGDVVKVKNEQEQYLHEAVITRIWEDLSANIIFDDGTTGICAKDAAKKTGRHIDINGLLKQIGGDE